MDKIEKLRNFLHESPDDSFLKHALALEMVKLGQDQEAYNLFTEILNLHPEYIGSYYHLGKLLERIGEEQKALKIYQKGMDAARKAGDAHALNELKVAWEALSEQ